MGAIQTTNYTIIVYKIEGQKTVPMMGCFISLAIPSILIQIMSSWACLKAMMLVYYIYYFQTTLSKTAKHWDSFLTHCILKTQENLKEYKKPLSCTLSFPSLNNQPAFLPPSPFLPSYTTSFSPPCLSPLCCYYSIFLPICCQTLH